jgi:hypothetical protein
MTLLIWLLVVGCNSVVLPWDRVELLTSSADAPRGCHSIAGLRPPSAKLVLDPRFATPAIDLGRGDIVPVMWPFGYSARRVWSKVEVSDASGQIVATTGQTYEFFYDPGSGGGGGQPFATCGVSPVPPTP